LISFLINSELKVNNDENDYVGASDDVSNYVDVNDDASDG
jgi:hypothetical protein